MQQSANELDQVRANRLAAADVREKAEREADEGGSRSNEQRWRQRSFLVEYQQTRWRVRFIGVASTGATNVEKEQEAY